MVGLDDGGGLAVPCVNRLCHAIPERADTLRTPRAKLGHVDAEVHMEAQNALGRSIVGAHGAPPSVGSAVVSRIVRPQHFGHPLARYRAPSPVDMSRTAPHASHVRVPPRGSASAAMRPWSPRPRASAAPRSSRALISTSPRRHSTHGFGPSYDRGSFRGRMWHPL